MEDAFGTVLIAVALVAALAACASFVGSGKIYGLLGRGDLSLDEPDLRPGPQPGTAAWDAEAAAELRQLLEAKSARRLARGEPSLDVDAEFERLSRPAPSVDPGLRAEVRDLVIATNERRARRGMAPLDVESEIDRRLRDSGA